MIWINRWTSPDPIIPDQPKTFLTNPNWCNIIIFRVISVEKIHEGRKLING